MTHDSNKSLILEGTVTAMVDLVVGVQPNNKIMVIYRDKDYLVDQPLFIQFLENHGWNHNDMRTVLSAALTSACKFSADLSLRHLTFLLNNIPYSVDNNADPYSVSLQYGTKQKVTTRLRVEVIVEDEELVESIIAHHEHSQQPGFTKSSR